MVSKQKPYNNGQWTASRFHAFIKSALRSASNRWSPKFSCIKAARTKRGFYKCVGFERDAHVVPASVVHKGKRVKNIYADHIIPVVDPIKGFQSWDDLIDRLFVEQDGYQALCLQCHSAKSKIERLQRKSKK